MQITEEILDVTLIEPGKKHPVIFEKFDELSEGETLTIHNNHDPKPLYYQLLGERGNIFNWKYTEEGPDWWKVNITKRGSSDGETLGEIAVKDIRKAAIFKKFGLDFCCGGKKTIKQACEEKGLDLAIVEKELSQTVNLIESRPLPYSDWEPAFLADYIVNTHHAYVRKTLPEINGYALKVLKHVDKHPELKKIQELVAEINEELNAHMIKEEKVLFPFIKELAQKASGSSMACQLGTVQSPINMMEMEHELVGKNLEEIRKLSSNYKIPADACATYTVFYKMMEEFESDLFIHIHLENNILFPKALALEKN